MLLLLLLPFSCDKLPQNGDLDGQWQLLEIQNFAASAPEATEQALKEKLSPLKKKLSPRKENFQALYFDAATQDVSDQRIYWSFQLDLLSIKTLSGPLNGHTGETVARFRHQGATLDITAAYIHFRDRDSLLTDSATQALLPVGICGNTAHFEVETISGGRLVLRDSCRRLTFRKF